MLATTLLTGGTQPYRASSGCHRMVC